MRNKFPIQKVSSKLKREKWFRDSVIYGVNIALEETNSIKPTLDTILDNYKTYNGDRNTDDMKKTFDPMSNLNEKYKPIFKSFSIIKDSIDELVGEYITRGVEYVIAALDRDAVNNKIKEDKERISREVMKIIQSPNIKDKDEIKRKLEDIKNFNFMSEAEVTANKVLTYYKNTNRVKYKEIEGFRNALITAVVGFSVYIENKQLKVDLHSSDEIFAVRGGNSSDLKDSEMIAFVNYLPKGKILDKYGEFLKKKDVNEILSEDFGYVGDAQTDAKHGLVFKSMEELNQFTQKLDGGGNSAQDVINTNGDIRVVTFKWLGYRKAYRREYFDENGEKQVDFVSEYSKPDESRGEVFKERYFTEWHEGTLIGSDIVVNAKVSDYQYRNVNNPIKNIPGFVGGYFNVGNERAKSIVDFAKPYLYYRDMIFARIEDILSKNIGKVIELDLAGKPAKWSEKKLLYYLKRYNILVKNSFAEGDKGKAKGKLAGQYTQGTRVLDAELGSSIGFLVNLLALVDSMISKVTGVTPQRLGAIQTRELVGNVERSRVQSSLITEVWFNRYEQIILDLYETIIEVSKRAVKEDDRLQFVLDDYSYAMLSSGISSFRNTSFGLFPINTKKYERLRSIMEDMAVKAVPGGSMRMSQFIALFDSNNTVEMINKQYKIEQDADRARENIEKAKQEARFKEIKLQQESAEYMMNLESKFDKELEALKGEFKILVETTKLQDKAISDNIASVLDVTNKKIVDEFNRTKLALETELKKTLTSQSV